MRSGGWLVPLALGALVAAHPSQASSCSAKEERLLAARAQRAALALARDGAAAHAKIMGEDLGLSPACRRWQARLDPAAASCTAREKALVLERSIEAMQAAAKADLEATLVAYERLRADLSPGCWEAAHFHRDPAVQAACTHGERLRLARSVDGWLLAVRRALRGDVAPLLAVLAVLQQLTPRCQAALEAARGGGGRVPEFTGGVLDHGGGVYSSAGGACTPGGCAVY